MYWYVTTWGWNALWRRVKRVVLRREAVVAGRCRRCGRCCQEIVLHVGGSWIRSKRRLAAARAKDPELERFEPVDRDDDGRIIFRCSWLGENGLCRDYENRLDMCSRHPNLSLYYSGVVLAPHCGYMLQGPTFKGTLRDIYRRVRGIAPPDFGDMLDRERKQARKDTEADSP